MRATLSVALIAIVASLALSPVSAEPTTILYDTEDEWLPYWPDPAANILSVDADSDGATLNVTFYMESFPSASFGSIHYAFSFRQADATHQYLRNTMFCGSPSDTVRIASPPAACRFTHQASLDLDATILGAGLYRTTDKVTDLPLEGDPDRGAFTVSIPYDAFDAYSGLGLSDFGARTMACAPYVGAEESLYDCGPNIDQVYDFDITYTLA